MTVAIGTPVRMEGRLDALSRWLWLVKWLLAIPHYVVLAFLWLAFFVTSVIAFFTILITARYPRPLFEFGVGVLRWSWRVAFYSYGTLGTDRYPPFTLADVSDYPARLDVAYPERLSRGLVLVKWWLLAIPHYLVIGLYLGAETFADTRIGEWFIDLPDPGLIGLLVLVAAVVLLVTGRYPHGVFAFVLGLNRWVFRVAAYAVLMTDDYPPFRLDMGGREPERVGDGGPESVAAGQADAGAPDEPPSGAVITAGRVVALVIAGIVGLVSLGLVTAGVTGLVVDRTQRDAAGFLVSSAIDVESTTSAVVGSGDLDVETDVPDWLQVGGLTGDVQVRVEADDGDPVFVGLARESAAAAYLARLDHDEITDIRGDDVTYQEHPGSAPTAAPTEENFWSAAVAGPGRQTLTFEPAEGRWVLVVMNTDGSAGIDVDARAAAEFPALVWVAIVALVLGGLGLSVAGLIVYLAVRERQPSADAQPTR